MSAAAYQFSLDGLTGSPLDLQVALPLGPMLSAEHQELGLQGTVTGIKTTPGKTPFSAVMSPFHDDPGKVQMLSMALWRVIHALQPDYAQNISSFVEGKGWNVWTVGYAQAMVCRLLPPGLRLIATSVWPASPISGAALLAMALSENFHDDATRLATLEAFAAVVASQHEAAAALEAAGGVLGPDAGNPNPGAGGGAGGGPPPGFGGPNPNPGANAIGGAPPERMSGLVHVHVAQSKKVWSWPIRADEKISSLTVRYANTQGNEGGLEVQFYKIAAYDALKQLLAVTPAQRDQMEAAIIGKGVVPPLDPVTAGMCLLAGGSASLPRRP
jgi:hypothetical protein